MATGHTYYQPSEAEQQFLAAGLVTLESLDPDYAEYVAKEPTSEPCDYAGWVNLKLAWDALNAQYEAEFGAEFPVYVPEAVAQRARQLLRDMDYYETLLGY